MMNPLQQLHKEKQSFWLDFISRNLLLSGELKRLIQEEGLRGMTSNPTIFEKAISSGQEYDDEIKKLAAKITSSEEIFEAIAVKDIQAAADILKPIFNESHGTDGFVSLEVNPHLANDTQGTIQEAEKLFQKVKRPNLMIKIPGTQAGLKAIEESIFKGINVNVTLLFSVENYKQVVEAYLKGLEQRVRKNLPIRNIVSVASFFVSRVDTVVDKMLDQIIDQGGSNAARASHLLHQAAIANAKLAYSYYEEVINGPRWQKLKGKGANGQRLLWGSTGTKDKRLSDVVYIEELIGSDTVNTMPPQTAEAFKHHGSVRVTITRGVDEARADLAALAVLGINLAAVTTKLQEDGVQLFIKSFDDLIQVVGAKRELLVGEHEKKLILSLGRYQSDYENALDEVEKENWVARIWNKDATLWKQGEEHQKIIKNSLGWLHVPRFVRKNISLIQKITADVKKGKFTHALLLGMGGSSLAPEVLRLTYGKKTGYPDLAILDSTEPASVLERSQRSKPSRTLYIVASKSGSTTEPNAFLATFYALVKKEKGVKAGENFIAITDPGTHLEQVAKEKKFRHIVLNPSDIGGRYSALSYFGMLPAALMGMNVDDCLSRASRMMDACSPRMPVSKNPGVRLGTALGVLANQGRDKATFFLSKDIASFSTWLEQLIAESTGKEGKGIVPVESEDIQSPDYYSSDRLFVYIRTKEDRDQTLPKKLLALEKAGHPVIRITLENKADLAGEFFRWEMATAIAGSFLEIDPFDQPNVQEAKDLTKEGLEKFKIEGKLPQPPMVLSAEGMSIFASNGQSHSATIEETLKSLWDELKPGDYVALLAYLTRASSIQTKLQSMRQAIMKSKKVATTVGFGPRFLHSTGQLHKGGANNGVFIQMTADDPHDIPIPGEPYTFSVLKEAQALGDFNALKNKGRRVIRIHFRDGQVGLSKLEKIISESLEIAGLTAHPL